MKVAGFTLIELMIVVAIIAIIAAIAIPNLIRSRMAANEASAIGTMHMISTAQAQFKSSGTNVVANIPQYGNLNSLANATPPFIDQVIGISNTPKKSSYNFTFALGLTVASPSFVMNAQPINTRSGSRNFFVDETGVITWLPVSVGVPVSTSPALQ